MPRKRGLPRGTSNGAGTSKSPSKEASGSPPLENMKCAICLSIMIEPVTLPCKHEMCRVCLDETLRAAQSVCPFCRTRLSIWVRRTTAAKGALGLVNQDKWQRIQAAYPEYTAKKMAGESVLSPGQASPFASPVKPHHQLAQPGEIRQEYEEELQAARREQMAEEAASTVLLESFAVEEREAAEQTAADESLARQLAGERTPESQMLPQRKKRTATWLDKFLVKHQTSAEPNGELSPYPYDCYTPSDGLRRQPPTGAALRCDSVDSIGPEVNIFAPIEPSPLTPTKKRDSERTIFDDAPSDEEEQEAVDSDTLSSKSSNHSIIRPTVKRDAAKENQNGEHNAEQNGEHPETESSNLEPVQTTDSAVSTRRAELRERPTSAVVLNEWVLPESRRKRPADPVARHRHSKRQKPSSRPNSKTEARSRSLLDFVVASPTSTTSSVAQNDEAFARSLQSQFDLENRWKFTALRFKGTEDAYSLRGSRNRASSSASSSASSTGRSTATPSSSTGASSVGPEH